MRMVKKRILAAVVLGAIALLCVGQPATAAPSSTAPTITSLSPATAAAGGPAFTLTVTGTNFISTSQVFFGHTLETTTYVSATQITAAIPASAIAWPRTVGVGVTNGPGSYSAPTSFSITGTATPAPTITSLSPTTTAAGGPAFTLTVNGTNFISTSQVWFGNTLATTTYVSATQLTAAIPASAIAWPRTVGVGVTNGFGSNSAPTAFSITGTAPVAPTVTSLSPTTTAAGGPAFTLTVNGTNFISTSQVYFGDTLEPTTYVSATQVTAAIPASAIAYPGKVRVGVTNGRGLNSTPISFPITGTTAPPPTVTSLSPDTAVAGGAAFTLTVTGTNFISTSQVMFGFVPMTTTYVSATQLTAAIPASAITWPGTVFVSVSNGPGSGPPSTASVAKFVITGANGPAPTITSLSPDSAVAGSGAFMLTVTGTNFTSTSQIYFGLATVPATYVSATELTAAVPAQAVGYPGNVPVVVSNGFGSTSQPTVFTVTPAPAVVQYFVGPSTTPSDDGVYVGDIVTSSTTIDLTQPVSVTLDNPAVGTTPQVLVYQTGSITLTAVTAHNSTYYVYRGTDLLVTAQALPNSQYDVNVTASGLDLSSIDLTSPVVITLTLDGQTFTTTVTPTAITAPSR